MQVCTSHQTDNHASTPPLIFYRPDALPATQPTASKHWRPTQNTYCPKSWEWNAFSKWHAMSPIWDFLDTMLCMLWSRSLLKLITCHTFWSLYTIIKHTHTHLTALFPGLPRSAGEQVSRYQKGKTNLDFSEARDSKWQWHQLGYMRLHLAPDRQPHQHPTTLFFYRPDTLPATQPTVSKHWTQIIHYYKSKQKWVLTLIINWLQSFSESTN